MSTPSAENAGSELPLRLVGLRKSYPGKEALRGIDLLLGPGEILGYLGPNGAGKTTTIRLVLGLLRPSAGRATVFGRDCWTERVTIARSLGYLAGDVRLYENLTGSQLLEMLDRLAGGGSEYATLAERLTLDLSRRIKEYSKGMKQKLGLIQALMHQPRLVILDEPTTALDPLVQQEVYALLREHVERGASVFFSSHVLSEVERLCDRVAIVRDGKLLEVADVGTVSRFDVRRARVVFAEPDAGILALERAGFVCEREGDVVTLQVQEVDRLIKTLASVEVAALDIERLTLEEVFLDAYRADTAP